MTREPGTVLGVPQSRRFLGRDDIARRITAMVRRASEGYESLALVSGPAGVGRTGVLEYIRKTGAASGLPALDVVEAEALAPAVFTPRVITIDDLHLRDAAFQSRVRGRAAQVRGFPVILAASAADAPVSWLQTYAEAGFAIVELEPLQPAVIADIVGAVEPGLSTARVRQICAASGGYPRHALELAREPHALVPSSVRTAIERWSRAHGSSAARTIAVLAVTAHDEGVDAALAQVVDERIDLHTLSTRWQAAAAAGFCDEVGRFRHPLVRLGFMARLGTQAAPLHRRCAEHLIAAGPTLATYERIADHLAQSGGDAEAYEYYAAAVSDDLAQFRYRRALSKLDRMIALEHVTESLRADAHARAAHACTLLGESKDAIAHANAALALHEASGNARAVVRSAVDAARTMARSSEAADAHALCRRILPLAEPSAFTYEHGMLLLTAAVSAAASQEEDKARLWFDRLSAYEAQWSDALRWNALRMRGLSRALYHGAAREAEFERVAADFDAALLAAERTGDASAISATYDVYSYVQLFRSDLAAAKRSAEQALEHACSIGDNVRTVRAQIALLRIASLDGSLPRSMALADIVHGHAEPAPYRATDTVSVARAAVFLRAERFLRIEPYRERYERTVAASDVINLQDYATAYAYVLLELGHEAKAAHVLDVCLQRLRHLDPTQPDIAFLAASFGEHRAVVRARSLLSAAGLIMRPELARGAAQLFAALCEGRAGNRLAAHQLGSAAARDFRALGWRWFEAQSLRAASQIAEAHAVESQMGYGPVFTGAYGKLSAREQIVARFVAEGASNREIASALHIAEKTVQAHMQAVLRKLGAKSRHQVAALITLQS